MSNSIDFTMHMQLDAEQMTNMTIWRTAVARAWSDPAFKTKLLANPKAVLIDMGAKLPPEVEVRIVEDSESTVHCVLPRPADVSSIRFPVASDGF